MLHAMQIQNRRDSGIIVELSNHSSTDSCSTQTINVKRISMVQITAQVFVSSFIFSTVKEELHQRILQGDSQ